MNIFIKVLRNGVAPPLGTVTLCPEEVRRQCVRTYTPPWSAGLERRVKMASFYVCCDELHDLPQ